MGISAVIGFIINSVSPYSIFLFSIGYIVVISIVSSPLSFIAKRITAINNHKVLKSILLVAPFLFISFTLYAFVIPENSVEKCNAINNGSNKQVACYLQLAENGTGGYEMCENIIIPEAKNRCLSQYVNYNPSTASEDICSGISSSPIDQWVCYQTLAAKSHSVNQCLNIEDQKLQDDCILYFNRYVKGVTSEHLCSRISAIGKKDECYKERAFQNKDRSICQFIQNEVTKDFCTSNTFY